jgi:alpha-D-ribose 1-methylphosphonate 5-triphosphate synthase subunit PhnL
MNTLLNINGLVKRFVLHTRGGKVIDALKDLSLEVREGEFLGLTGPSGSGKSTILKCIYRTYVPTQGEIWYKSGRYGTVNLASLSEHAIIDLRKNEIGFVSQFLKIIPRVSALDIVAEPLFTRNGTTPEKARLKAVELLERLHIYPQLFDAYPLTFSGGEQQRINIARAVICRPRVLLLDEPTSMLDQRTASLVLDMLGEIRNEGTTMIGVFHDVDTLRTVADRVYDLERGAYTNGHRHP